VTTSDPTTERRVPLGGASNFRDLGGYEARDGRRVRWRRLYRSSSLAALTDDDLLQVSRLSIRTVCDLRRDEERDEEPSRLPQNDAPRVVHLPVGPKREESKIYEHLADGDATPAAMYEAMIEIYRAFALDFMPQYTELVRRVARSEHLPLLFHCTAGKDRTGFAAALVLEAIGVPRTTILADYELTNDYWSRDITERYPRLKSPELFHTLLSANPDYLLAAFSAIEERFSDFDAYLSEGLEITPDERERLRDHLLD